MKQPKQFDKERCLTILYDTAQRALRIRSECFMVASRINMGIAPIYEEVRLIASAIRVTEMELFKLIRETKKKQNEN